MPLPGAIKEDMREIQNRLDECDRLEAINAELLAALEAVLNASIYADGEGLIGVEFALSDCSAEDTVLKQAHEAIAKAKAGKE